MVDSPFVWRANTKNTPKVISLLKETFRLLDKFSDNSFTAPPDFQIGSENLFVFGKLEPYLETGHPFEYRGNYGSAWTIGGKLYSKIFWMTNQGLSLFMSEDWLVSFNCSYQEEMVENYTFVRAIGDFETYQSDMIFLKMFADGLDGR